MDDDRSAEVLDGLADDEEEASEPATDHAPTSSAFTQLQERVNQHYGAFGVRVAEEDEDFRRASGDTGRDTTVKVVAGIAGASLLLSFVSHPTFDGPGAWANGFRLDTVFAVVWAPILFWVMARQKLWQSVRVYLVLALFIETFSEVMFKEMGEGGYWDSLMWPAAVGYFGTLKELGGLPGASLSVFTLVSIGLLIRALRAKKSAFLPPPPRFARDALLVFLGTIVTLAIIGLARGGQFEWTFRQTIHLLHIPLVGLVFLYALRVPEDLAAIGTTFVVTAIARSLLVAYVYFGVCMPQGITDLPGKPEWCTNHSDTVLFVTALVILFAHALEERKKDVVLRSLGYGLVILVGIILNNRRLAFVSLTVAPIAIYFTLAPSARKRRVTLALALLVPVLTAYVLIGAESGSTSPLFKPAKSIVSVLDQKDTSSMSRDIENENLIFTTTQNPLLVRGFGHEYESSPNNPPVDLSEVFKNYRLIAHNGVLWLWSIAGVFGFTALWLVFPLTGTLAIRGYRVARTGTERTAALASLGGVAVCVVQVWGDQGFSSYLTIVVFGVCFAVASRLAVRSALRT